MSSVAITLTEPWVYLPSNQGERLSLPRIRERGAHLHGALVFRVAGRAIPGLGYFGPSDVCVGMWAAELAGVANALRVGASTSYVFDEGEQEQPAFEFVRESDTVFISLVASESSGAGANPDWQRVPCSYAEFEAAIHEFLGALQALLKDNAGDRADAVWSHWIGADQAGGPTMG